MNPIDYRIKRFQELIDKGKYYRIMNWNLVLIRKCFWKGNGKFIKPDQRELLNHYEDFGFF
jgi:hypothetical protein